jgi:(4-(4-[2-(gamma-L-glutamylamino)ethyl]phenoxymethyl)furan-2-yl)methanamine synthase
VSPVATGWDVGGAHLKAAQADARGRLFMAAQVPCQLWMGMDRLARALKDVRRRLRPSAVHAITMTGELVDLFPSRAQGVAKLIAAMNGKLAGAETIYYAGPAGWMTASAARRRWRDVASANWHASALLAAGRWPGGLLVDIGSTTTDIVPFGGGQVRAEGLSDHERMVADELVYTGATRTPAMVMAGEVRFAGERQRMMNEFFATAADVHRLTGRLPAGADQHASADGRGKSVKDSARRLARMLGRDMESAPLAAWRKLAAQLAEHQLDMIADAAERVAWRAGLEASAPVVGAGVGRFIARDLAVRLKRPYADAALMFSGASATREWAARCLPAAALAVLAASSAERTASTRFGSSAPVRPAAHKAPRKPR